MGHKVAGKAAHSRAGGVVPLGLAGGGLKLTGGAKGLQPPRSTPADPSFQSSHCWRRQRQTLALWSMLCMLSWQTKLPATCLVSQYHGTYRPPFFVPPAGLHCIRARPKSDTPCARFARHPRSWRSDSSSWQRVCLYAPQDL